MRWLLELLRALLFRRRSTAMVRPWALSAPVLVLLLTVPLLRPVWQPDPTRVSDDELAILGTTQALVEQQSLAIDRTAYRQTRRAVEDLGAPRNARVAPDQPPRYAEQPPMLALLLSGPYRVMRFYGLTFRSDGPMVEFLLTILGSALPAASAAGLVYRMGRLFELDRPLRALLGFSAVFATGLGSYATVLNPHVPAATLVLASAACLVHLAIATGKPMTAIWLALAGLAAGAAATIDPSALPYVPLLSAVTLALRGVWYRRVARFVVYCLGVALPVAVHLSMVLPAFNDPLFGAGVGPPPRSTFRQVAPPPPVSAAQVDSAADEEPRTFTRNIGQAVATTANTLAGRHGPLSHFPILALGAAGVFMVMHRHWPKAAKVLAAATLAGVVFLVVAYAVHRPESAAVGWRSAMFASRWFVVFSPLLLYWAGAWMRRPHSATAWVVAVVVLLFSLSVGVIGAFAPWPRDGYSGYTAVEAARQLWATWGM